MQGSRSCGLAETEGDRENPHFRDHVFLLGSRRWQVEHDWSEVEGHQTPGGVGAVLLFFRRAGSGF